MLFVSLGETCVSILHGCGMTPNTMVEKSLFAVAVLWSGTSRAVAESLDQGLVSWLQAVGQDLCQVHVPERHEAAGRLPSVHCQG